MLLRMLARSASITPGTTAISWAAHSAARGAATGSARREFGAFAAFAARTDLAATGMVGDARLVLKLVSRA
jgi:hypothetical protein